MIDSLTLVSAKRIESFDFATVYTNLSLNVVFDNLKTVIKKSFLLSSKRFLKIDIYNKKAIWTNCFNTTVNLRCYSLNMIFELLEFVLYNSYIRFGGDLYKQIVGIPMGGDTSPVIADLFLSHQEYKYMMDKNNPINLKHALSNNKRYLDDILVLNCKDFIDISKNIYPSEPILEASHGTGHEDHFLDLNINICDNNKLSLKCIIKRMILILK